MLLKENDNILIAEDDDDDFLLIQEVLEEVKFNNPIIRAKDGEELVKYLLSNQERPKGLPAFIFLDLNMPKKNGLEALQEIKENPKLQKIPIIVLTTSNVPKDVIQSYSLGSNAFVTKPGSYVTYIDTMQKIIGFWRDANQYSKA